MDMKTILNLIQQAYYNQVQVLIYTKTTNDCFVGQFVDVHSGGILLVTKGTTQKIMIEQIELILKVELWE